MPEAVGSVEIQITGNTDLFEQALTRAKTAAANIGKTTMPTNLSDQFTAGALSANKMADSFKNVEKSAGPLSNMLGGLSEQVVELAKGYAALLTVEKVVDFVKESVQAFAEQQRQVTILEQQLSRLGSRTSLTMDTLDAYRESLVATTQATNEQVRAAETAALRLGVTGDTMGKVLTTAQNLAAVDFGNLISNTDLLARAIENPERVLNRLSLRFPELAGSLKGVVLGLRQMGDSAGAANLIMDTINKSVGGAGAAANAGLIGSFTELGKALEELKVNVGNFIAGPSSGFDVVIKGLTNDINAMGRAVNDVNAYFDSLDRKYEKIKIILGGDWYKMGPHSPISASQSGKGDFLSGAAEFSNAFQSISAAADEMQKHLDAALEGVTDPAKRQSIIETTLALFHWGDAIGATTKHLQELAQAEKDRASQRQTDIASAQLELSLAGKSLEDADAQRKIFQDISALKEKLKDEGGIPPGEEQAIRDTDTAIAHINQTLRETSTLLGLQQDQQLLFASDTENKVATALKSVYGDAWPKYTDSLIAQQVRLNENLQQTYDLTRSFAGTFVDDMLSGKSAVDSVTDALNNLEKTIINMALDNAVKGLFGLLTASTTAQSGNFFTNLFSGGGAGGGGVPHAQTGGYIGSTPLHTKKRGEKLAYDEFPAVLHIGERVIPRGGGEPKINVSGEQMLRMFGGVPKFDDGWGGGSYSTSATGVSTSGHDTSYWGGGGGIQSGFGGTLFGGGGSSGDSSSVGGHQQAVVSGGGAWQTTPSGSFSYQNATGFGVGGGYQGTYKTQSGATFTYESGPPLTSGSNLPFGAGGAWGIPAPIISAPVRRSSGGGGGGVSVGGGGDGGGGDATPATPSEIDNAFANPISYSEYVRADDTGNTGYYGDGAPPAAVAAGWDTAFKSATTYPGLSGGAPVVAAPGGFNEWSRRQVSYPGSSFSKVTSTPVPTTSVYPNLWVSGDAQAISGGGRASVMTGDAGFTYMPLPQARPDHATPTPSYAGFGNAPSDLTPWVTSSGTSISLTGGGTFGDLLHPRLTSDTSVAWTSSDWSGRQGFYPPGDPLGAGNAPTDLTPWITAYGAGVPGGAGLPGFPVPRVPSGYPTSGQTMPGAFAIGSGFYTVRPFGTNVGAGTMVGAGAIPSGFAAPPSYGGAFPWNAGNYARPTGRQPYSGFIMPSYGGSGTVYPSDIGTIFQAHPTTPIIGGGGTFFDQPPAIPPYDTGVRALTDAGIARVPFGTATRAPFGFGAGVRSPVDASVVGVPGVAGPSIPMSTPISGRIRGGTLGEGGWYGGQGTSLYPDMAPYPLTQDLRPPGWVQPPFPYPEGSAGWWMQRIGTGLGNVGDAAGNAAGAVRDFFLGGPAASAPASRGLNLSGGVATPGRDATRIGGAQWDEDITRYLQRQANPALPNDAPFGGGRAVVGPHGTTSTWDLSVNPDSGNFYQDENGIIRQRVAPPSFGILPSLGGAQRGITFPANDDLGNPMPGNWPRPYLTPRGATWGGSFMGRGGQANDNYPPSYDHPGGRPKVLQFPGVYHSGGVVGSTPVWHRMVPPRIFVNAPRFQEGLEEGEYPAILHHGETVTPAGGRPSRASPNIVVNTPPAPAPVVSVTVVNNSSSSVSTASQDDQNGNIKLDIIIDELVSGKMRDGGSKISKTLSSMGARAQPLRR